MRIIDLLDINSIELYFIHEYSSFFLMESIFYNFFNIIYIYKESLYFFVYRWKIFESNITYPLIISNNDPIKFLKVCQN